MAIGWNAETWSRFHNIWLRDHCRCSECFHAVTKQRLFDTFEIPADIQPLDVKAIPEGLQVTWPASTPHISLYPWSWLQTCSYDPPFPHLRPESESKTHQIIWGSKIQQAPPTVTYEEVMESGDFGLYKWLQNIDRFGFSFVNNVPVTTEATEELATRIGFIRETQYGKFWDFTSNMAKGDTAYTDLALSAHTDNTYFTDPAGLQMFHMLSHTEGSGGASLLVDGFYAASILRDLHPESYELLTRIPVPAHAAGEEGCLYRSSPPLGYPVLSVDRSSGALYQVRWNNDDRSVLGHVGGDELEKLYEAMRIWNRLLKISDSEYWVQLTPGTVVIMNNHRVLHGRSAFTGRRRMCGAYIGIDEYTSKLAVLEEKFSSRTSTPSEGQRSVWHPKF